MLNQHSFFGLGSAKFKSKLERLPNSIQKVLKTSQWWIAKGQYTQQNWSRIFLELSTVSITLLYLHDNFYANILREISSVNFTALKAISLVNNNITNVQAFCFMNCRNITHIYMNFNHIQSIDCLSKCELVNLQYFSLRKNPLNQIDMGRFKTRELKTLLFQGILDDDIEAEDCCFLAKIKSYKVDSKYNSIQNLGIIGVKSEKRLRQDKVVQILKHKFKKLKLDYPKKSLNQ